MELRQFFDRAIRASFRDLSFRDDPATEYLADLLTRFARTENLYLRGHTLPRLETVVDMMLEAQNVWREDTRWWQPEHELQVRRHIGDYTMFMTGVFRERVERIASTGLYVAQGKRAYHFVFEHDRAAAHRDASIFRRLADRFESYARALDYARHVHFVAHPERPFLRFGFG